MQQKKGQTQMCTVSINIDEATMQQIDPSLTTQVSISRWLQHQVNLMLEEMTRDMTVEELYKVIEQDIKAIYANESL